MTWCAPSPWYSQVCWLLRTKSLIFTFWLPMYLWKSRIFNCLNSSKLSTPMGTQEKPPDSGAGNSSCILYLENHQLRALQKLPSSHRPQPGLTVCSTGRTPSAHDHGLQQSSHLQQGTKSNLPKGTVQGQNSDRQNIILNFKKLLKPTNQCIKREKQTLQF